MNSSVSAMELFGQAIYDKYNGIEEPFYFIVNGNKNVRSVDRYLRKASDLSDLERKLIDRAYGKILDVGCGTGNYMSVLSKKGEVTGIDISENVIKIARIMGNTNCFQGDIFNYTPKVNYDTITFLENNFGMATNVKSIKKLIQKLKKILKSDGQILLIQGDIVAPGLVVNTITVEYKKIKADFKWAHSSKKYLEECFLEEGFDLKEIGREGVTGKEDMYLAVVTNRKSS